MKLLYLLAWIGFTIAGTVVTILALLCLWQAVKDWRRSFDDQ